MENYILNRKILEIEKNKEYAFRIPTMFNAAACEFILEVTEEHIKENLQVELAIKNPNDLSESNLKFVRTHVNQRIVRFRATDLPEIEPRDYLLFGCRANQACQLALSIVER